MSSQPDDEQRYAESLRANSRELVLDGTHWRVYEIAGRYDRRSGPVLTFESEDVTRFVRQYPSDWRELTDDALYGLSLRGTGGR